MKHIKSLIICFSMSLSTVYAQHNEEDVLFKQTYEKYNQHRYSETFPAFSQLANNGYSKAYGYLGLAYELGEGVEKNTALMCEWYDRAIQTGQSWCGWRLGKYLADIGQYYLAVDVLDIASRSSNFSGEASFLLGQIYEKGNGVVKDINKAIEYYKIASKYSFTDDQAMNSLTRLGVTLYNDSEFNDATPEMIADKSAKQLFDLGYSYHSGGIRGKDYPKAYAYLKAAADMNYPEALKWMGYLSTDEAYPIKSQQQAKIYFDRAIEEFKERAKESISDYGEIADFYRRGLGRDIDLDEAAYWYRMGSELGDASCQLWLGQILDEKGKYKEALAQLELSANQGQGWAAYLVGDIYDNGRKIDGKYVIEQNIEKAIYWYKIASQTNNYYANEAKIALKRIGYTE